MAKARKKPVVKKATTPKVKITQAVSPHPKPIEEIVKVEPPKPKRVTNLNAMELQVYDKVVDALPKLDAFTSKNHSGFIDEDFVRSSDGKIVISVEYGNIVMPYKFNLTEEEKKVLIDLVKPIVEREKEESLKLLLKK